MKVRIKHTSYVIDFLDKGFSSENIGNELKTYIEEILNNIVIPQSLCDWETTFKILYSGQDKILIFRKGKSYKAEKYKEIVVHLPIPTIDKVEWGVEKKQRIKTGINEYVLKRADILEINPVNYKSRESFILESMLMAIKEIFNLGFTINNIKIKSN